MEEIELIAVRIKDGIFAGNVAASEDREFLGMNKITHIINCAGAEVADCFVGDPELHYLSFPWKDTAGTVCTTILFDPNDKNINKAVEFIDEAMALGDCVLVHSYNGISRSPALIAAYFIVKYGWKLESALSFLRMAHPDVNIKPHFLQQLRLFAKRHHVEFDIFDRTVDDSSFGLDNDQWMLRNTLLNGLTYPEQEANDLFHVCTAKVEVGTKVNKGSSSGKRLRISFVDTKQGTGVDAANSTPVVPGRTPPTALHADPNAARNGTEEHFVGSQGPVALRMGSRSPSILSRSTSPCSRHLESDPRTNPKGRQELKKLPSGRPATKAGTSAGGGSPPLASATSPAPLSATIIGAASSGGAGSASAPQSSPQSKLGSEAPSTLATPLAPGTAVAHGETGNSTAPGNEVTGTREFSVESSQGRASYYERLAPPKPSKAATSSAGLPTRSPLATLTSKHKFRNGSPLPLLKDKGKDERKQRTRIVSSPSSRTASATGSPNSPRGARSASASSKDRTSSPTAMKKSNSIKSISPSTSSSAGVTREANSRYVAITPQRSGNVSGRPAWNSATSGRERPTVTRPLSPVHQGLSASSPVVRPRQRSNSTRSHTSSQSDKDGSRRRTGSSPKKRPSSPKKHVGTPSKGSSSSNSSNSPLTATPNGKKSSSKAVNSPSSQSKVRRQPPPAVTPSRQQQ